MASWMGVYIGFLLADMSECRARVHNHSHHAGTRFETDATLRTLVVSPFRPPSLSLMAYNDRLAAARARRGQAIELSDLNGQPAPATPTPASPAAGQSDLPAFLAEDASIQQGIQQLKNNVAQLATLRLQSLNAIDDSRHTYAERIDSLTTETRTLTQELKERIQNLERTPLTQDAQLRRNRLTLLRTKFLEALQDYQREEQEGRVKSRERVERQLKIVYPKATPEEVATAVNGGGDQIFAQALTSSTRYGESRAAYREVQERQQDLRRVEQTLAELAQLFSDMGTLVEQQDAIISDVEKTAQTVTEDTEKALKNTETAVVHAKSYRKGRWICFFIFLVCIAILAIVLGIVFGRR
ncbi:unnamed protein product [Cyclocybe aegerita]|uniref:t-SNARE coiled-coil homology domain-containing protein n=1 Tax=Cyclocybe aegerita TaxID=1973307 RepID=A0A8S0W1H1_CYCAE|nr:unnamed protein product [Cyclocybe aegerita]